MKATAIAPSNIAFIKYWGKKNKLLKIPENGSISMNLSNLTTTTTVEFDARYKEDYVLINNKNDKESANKVIEHLELIRQRAKIRDRAKVHSLNNFPVGTGLSSSASGFAALTLAASHAAGLHLSEKELSMLARQGSGSACRSIPDGIVEWLGGDTSATSYAKSLYPPDYWAIVDIVAIISKEKKDLSSTEGQKLVSTSPFFQTRLAHINAKIAKIKALLKAKNFTEFGQLVENEALELHAIMLTSTPSLIYWQPKTIELMKLIKKWRSEGLEVYFTVNTGQDMHLIIEDKNKAKLLKKLQEVDGIREIIVNRPSVGTKLSNKHLF